ncbi:DUF1917-domain-containing protein [Parathielavia appendiculata]|uniref:DUF1917-domain-containing protein n=1 Tax=Parathielavia appendiculata TaxID=2587402 RepID=A0AAN6TWJ1_9PEZI|nr:DUF1917-domain-containing protein [Parathielavia appendiculata]
MESNANPRAPSQWEQYNAYCSVPGAPAKQTKPSRYPSRACLPPRQILHSSHLRPPWYSIVNPNRSAYPNGRADIGDVHSFTREGHALLQEFQANITQCAKNDSIRTQLREVLKGEAGGLASSTTRKVYEVNDVWRRISEGVDSDRLGTAAKVSTSCQVPGDPTRLICVYTKDSTDVADVKRVLHALVDMGFVTAHMPEV